MSDTMIIPANWTKKDFTIKIALRHREDSLRFDISQQYDCWDEPNMKARRLQLGTEICRLKFMYARKFDDAYELRLIGCLSDEDMETTHYQIDDALRKEFGSAVSTDSESGGFFTDCTRKSLEVVQRFLAEKYPHLKYSVNDCMDDEAKLGTDPFMIFPPSIPGVAAYQADTILRENGIDDPVIEYTVTASERLVDNLLREAADAIAKTGLSREKVRERLDNIGWQHEA